MRISILRGGSEAMKCDRCGQEIEKPTSSEPPALCVSCEIEYLSELEEADAAYERITNDPASDYYRPANKPSEW